MPLETQNITIPLGRGADTKTDPKMIAPDRPIIMENGVFSTIERVSKRYGYSALTKNIASGGIVPGGDRMDTYGNQPLIFDENALYGYSSGSMDWGYQGFIPALNVVGEQVYDSTTAQSVPDSATTQGVSIYAWEDSAGGVQFSVYDESTEAALVSGSTANASGVTPKCIGFLNELMVLYRVAGTIRCRIYNLSDHTIGNEITITSDIDAATGRMDVHDNGLWGLIVYQTAGGAVKVAWIKSNGAFAGAGDPYPAPVTFAENPTNSIGLEYDAPTGYTYVSWSNATPAVRLWVLDPAFGTLVQPVTLDATATAVRNVTGLALSNTVYTDWYYEYTSAQTYNAYIRKCRFTRLTGSISFAPAAVSNNAGIQINLPLHGLQPNDIVMFTNSGGALPTGISAATNYYAIIVDANNIKISATQGPGAAVAYTNQGTGTHTIIPKGRIGTSAIFARGMGLIAKAFQFQGIGYIATSYQTLLNSTNFILDDSGNCNARMLSTQAGGLTAKACSLPQVVPYTGSQTRLAFPSTRATRITASSGTISYVTGVWEHEILFTLEGTAENLNRYTAQAGKILFSMGAALWAYDGNRTFEHGFHYPPENISATQAAGGSLTLLGTYQYSVMWEWADGKGNLHRSAPSVPLTVTLSGANNKITLTIPTLRLTAKSNVSVVIYRTAANLTTAYRITSITSPTLNDKTVDSISYVDSASDASITANEIIYTTGNVLSNDAAPASQSGTTGKSRLFVINAEDPNTIWYSKRIQIDRGIAFSQYQTIRIPSIVSDISNPIGMGVIDEHIVAFKRSSIFIFGGDGPDDTGGNGIFSQPQLLTTDVGCINANTIVMMPTGLMFQSAKGIYHLDRRMQVNYIGAPVEAYNNQTYVSAILLQDKNQVRFLAQSGVSLVYDYYFNQWSTFTNVYGYGATLYNGQYAFLRPSGEVWVETPGTYSDNGAYIPMRIRTGWISFSGINGFQRVYRAIVLGSYIGAHYLKMKIAYDFNNFFRDEIKVSPRTALNTTTYGSDAYYGQSSPYGGQGDKVEQFEAFIPNQRCTAIQFEITDEMVDSPNEGLNLSALTLTIGAKKGMNKLPSTKRLT